MVDFFFVVEEVPDDEGDVACCGADEAADAMAARADGRHALIASARSSDAAIGSLVIFLRCSSLPGL